MCVCVCVCVYIYGLLLTQLSRHEIVFHRRVNLHDVAPPPTYD